MRESLSICEILFIVFLVLKLTGNIVMPWIWVFSPVWIPSLLIALAYVAVFIDSILPNSNNKYKDDD